MADLEDLTVLPAYYHADPKGVVELLNAVVILYRRH